MAGNPVRRAAEMGADVEVGDKTRTTITSTVHKEVMNPDEVERANLAQVDWDAQPQRLFTAASGQWIFLTRLPHRLAPEELERNHGRASYRQIPILQNAGGREIEHEAFMRVDHVGTPQAAVQMPAPAAPDATAGVAALMQQLLPAIMGTRQAPTESLADVMYRQTSEQAKIEEKRLEREERREDDRRLREEKREQLEREREQKREDRAREERAADQANKQSLLTAAMTILPTIMGALRPPASTGPDPAVSAMLGLIEKSSQQTERILLSMAERRDTPRDRGQEQLVSFLTTQLQSAQQQAMSLLSAPKTTERPAVDPMMQLYTQMQLMEKMRNMFSDDAPEEEEDMDPMMQAGLLALVGQAKPEMLPMLQSVLSKRRGKEDDNDDDDDDAHASVSVRADRLFAKVAQDPALAAEVQRRLEGASEPAPQPPVQRVQPIAVAQQPEAAQDELSILDAVRRRQQQQRAGG